MAPDTSFLGMSYPEENQDPYFEVLSSFFDQIDQNIYTNFAHSQLLTGGGKLGITEVDANTKRFTWTEDFEFPILVTGKTLYLRYNRGTTDRFIDLINGDRVVFDIYLTSAEDVIADVYKVNGGLTSDVAPIPKVFTLGIMVGGEFYTQLKNYLGQEVSIDGALGIGTQGDTDASAKLHVFTETSSNPSALKAILADARPKITQSTTYNTSIIFAGNRDQTKATMVIPSGVTNSGYFHGVRSEAIRTNTTDQGTLSSLAAMSGYYGHETTLNSTAATSNAYGLLLTPYHQKGTISNSYGIYLADALVGGTATNAYGIYQAASTFKNAFMGAVGVGKVPGVGTTTGYTTQTFSLDVANANDLIFRGKGTTSTKSAQLHFFNNLDKGLRVSVYGGSFSGSSEFSLGSNGVSMVTDSAGPFAIGTYGVAQPLILATNSSERLRIDSSGNVGIGISTTALGRVHAAVSGSTITQLLDSHHTTPQSGIVGRTSRGTQLSPTATQSGDNLFYIGGRGYGTSAFASSSRSGIELHATETWTNSSQGAGIKFYTTANLGTTTTNKMWLSADGSLGIGTDTPDQILEISKDVDGTALRITSTQNDSAHSTVNPFTSVEFYSNDASGPGASVRARVGAQFVDASGAGTALTFSTSTSAGLAEAMRLDNFGNLIVASAGSVGIGGTPTTKLEVFGSAGNIQIASTGNRITYTRNGANYLTASGNSAIISYECDNHQFYNGAGTVERMRIDSAGNVGIGTSSPSSQEKLHVSSAGSSSIRVTGSTDARLVLEDSSVADSGRPFQFILSDDGNLIFGNANRAGSSTTSSAERLRIDSSGRVLIGTSVFRSVGGANGAALEIEGTNSENSSASFVRNVTSSLGPILALGKTRGASVGGTTAVTLNDTLGTLNFSGSDGTDLSQAASISAGVDGTVSANTVPGRLVFSTTAAVGGLPLERLRIDSAGNVGIGTVSPLWRLHVLGATNTSGGLTSNLILSDSASFSGNVGGGVAFAGNSATGQTDGTTVFSGIKGGKENGTDTNTSGYLALFTRLHGSNPLERLRIDSSGNVGIGTSGPTARFDVRGADLDGDQLVAVFRHRNTAATDDHGLYVYTDPGTNYVNLVSTGTQAGGFTFRSDVNERLRIDSSGNVGIGVTSPTRRLEVGGTASGNNNVIVVGTPTASVNNSGLIVFRDDAATDRWATGILQQTAATAFSIRDIVAGAERLRIDSAGRVGVGIVSPIARLHVSGADNTFIFGVSGATNGVRIGASSVRGSVEAVDSTLGASYQPLHLAGSEITIATSTTERIRITSTGTIQFAGDLSNGTNAFANADLFSLRNVRFRDAAKTQAVQGGDKVVYDSASSTWLATAGMSVASVSVDTTLTGANEVVLVNASGGARTITLPAAVTGKSFTVKKTDASANTVTVAAAGASTIDGNSSVTIPAQYDAIQVVSDGTNWFLI